MNEIEIGKTAVRSRYLDMLKAVNILLVLFGHCIQFGSGYNYYNEGFYFMNPAFTFIYSFHMPLFMLISGYLFGFSLKKKNWTAVIKDKIYQLIIPLFFWGLISLFIDIILCFWNRTADNISFKWLIKQFAVYFINGPNILLWSFGDYGAWTIKNHR